MQNVELYTKNVYEIGENAYFIEVLTKIKFDFFKSFHIFWQVLTWYQFLVLVEKVLTLIPLEFKYAFFI